MSILDKLTDFIKNPRIPWFIISSIKKVSPTFARILKYGHTNINTSSYWDDQWTQRDFGERDSYYEALTEHVVQMIPAESKLLDAGCGPGGLLAKAKESKNCKCTGIDISQVAINETIKKGFDGYVANLPEIPNELAIISFDVITMMEILEHLDNPDKAIGNISNLVRPGGMFIASVPNDSMGPEEMDEHMQQFTVESLSELVGRYFEVTQSNVVKIKSLEYLVVVGKKPN